MVRQKRRPGRVARSERIKALEERFGVSATAVAVAAPAAASAPTKWTDASRRGGVEHRRRPAHRRRRRIQSHGAADHAGQHPSGLKEAKALVDEAPKPVKEGIDREEADKLEEAGAGVELK